MPPSNYQWSTRPAYNSVLDLSPSLDLSEPYTIDAVLLVKSLVASAVLQYTSTAFAMPWEVGKLLLQVQWVPRNAVLPEQISEGEEEEEVVSSNQLPLRHSGDEPTR
jgi:fusion and transport protein UGO1